MYNLRKLTDNKHFGAYPFMVSQANCSEPSTNIAVGQWRGRYPPNVLALPDGSTHWPMVLYSPTTTYIKTVFD